MNAVCPWASVGWGGGARRHGHTNPAQRPAGAAGTALRGRLAHASGSLMEGLPAFHGLTPPQEGRLSPTKCLPPCRSLAANCQVLQGQDVGSHCAGEREQGAKRDHSEGRLPAMASSTCSHRTEDISLFVQVFSFASPEWDNICFVYNPQASP